MSTAMRMRAARGMRAGGDMRRVRMGDVVARNGVWFILTHGCRKSAMGAAAEKKLKVQKGREVKGVE